MHGTGWSVKNTASCAAFTAPDCILTYLLLKEQVLQMGRRHGKEADMLLLLLLSALFAGDGLLLLINRRGGPHRGGLRSQGQWKGRAAAD